jgi:hypothetical protein
VAENLAAVPELKAGQDVILPLESPIKPEGHIQILYGNLAPEGSVAKITGKEGLRFEGTVRVARWWRLRVAVFDARVWGKGPSGGGNPAKPKHKGKNAQLPQPPPSKPSLHWNL